MSDHRIATIQGITQEPTLRTPPDLLLRIKKSRRKYKKGTSANYAAKKLHCPPQPRDLE